MDSIEHSAASALRTNPKSKPLHKLLTKFSNSNFILRYYGSFLECRRKMLYLCSATRKQFTENLKAYRYGLRMGGREKVIELDSDLTERLLAYINSTKLYKWFDLRLKLVDKYDVQRVADFIESVEELEVLQFDKIIVPDNWYNQSYSILFQLYDVLERFKINPT
jgi:hypothetical protein